MKTVIVGAGISGLATAHALLERQPDPDLLVFESADRPGGKIWSEKTPEGFLCEWGVNAFLDSKPKTLQLARSLSLAPVTSYDASRHRFVYSNNGLRKLPGSPPAFLKSDLISWPGKLRILMETLAPKTGKDEETLKEFAVRRLGREAYEKLIDPMASGVFAGDPEKMSVNSCFPRIKEIENEYRSLIIGLIRLQIKAAKAGRKDRPQAGPSGKLTSFYNGMSELSDAIAARLGGRLRLSTGVESLTRNGKHYILHLSNGKQEEAERVILAAPAYAQAGILKNLAPDIAQILAEIYYPPLAVCCYGYQRNKIMHDLNGFGFLVPSRERRKILGTLWDVSIFPNRAPDGYVLLRTMVGGARAVDYAIEDKDKLADMVRGELAAIMGIDAMPDFVKTCRHEQSIPQYNLGHAKRLQKIDQLLQKHPDLILTGNAFKGVALNDCVANAYHIADSLAL
ncbi:MAG: protoporphyrinogen oxidase [Gammaproteobacteria bacterium]|nr:protoporphyrinogen oxidase [Gammaproteobacteria bacterium]